MAASSNPHLYHHQKTNISSQPPPPSPATFDPAMSLPIPNTTFVQADPSNFRAVVQKLTGAPPPPPPSSQDSLLSIPKPTRLAGKSNPGEMGPRRPVFKLHERRLQTARKLEIKLNDGSMVVDGGGCVGLSSLPSSSSSSPSGGCCGNNKGRNFSGFVGEMVMVSPVSPLELLLGVGGSPRTPNSPMEDEEEEEERKAIAEKGFYLHPSPLSTPRGSEPPELLPLFPLHSPKTTTTDHHHHPSSF